MSLTSFNFREFGLDEILECLTNTGYLINAHERQYEFSFARDNDAYKYMGFVNNNHKFNIAFYDEEQENYYVTSILIHLGSEGKLVADYIGCPLFEGTEEQVLEFLELVCN